MKKTTHFDKYGDALIIYTSPSKTRIFVDGMFDDLDSVPAWRGIFTPEQARVIAKRLNQLADICE